MVEFEIEIENALLAREITFFVEQITPSLTEKYGSGRVVLTQQDKKTPEAVVLKKPIQFEFVLNEIEEILLKRSLKEGEQFKIGRGIIVDRYKRILKTSGMEIELTEKEVSLLDMMAHSEESVSREHLLSQIWGYQKGIDTHTLETHIYRLRQKLEEKLGYDLIVTKENGYSIESSK